MTFANLLANQHFLAGQKSNLYIPVPATSTNEPLRSDGETRGIGRAGNGDGAARRDEFMHVDDAPDRIYIHDLDAELADIEAEEGGLVYLPDIERKISKIPKHVLMGGASKDRDTSHELVLYRPPMSFLAPTGLQDATRESETSGDNTGKDAAVGSARQQSPYADHEPETAHGLSAADYDLEELDEDAMDTS